MGNNKVAGNVNSTYTSSQVKDDDKPYGKDPEPILIAIGENNQVNKNLKELTREDLKKVKNLLFSNEYGFNYVAKKYGFKENEEYDFSIILEMPNLEALSIDFGTSNIRLKDYSILKKNNNLKRLTISNIHDSDINNIVELNTLKSDANKIEGMDNIEEIIIKNTKIVRLLRLKNINILSL